MSIIFGFVNSFFTPAYKAILPQLVAKDDLASANALNGISSKLALLISPLLGAGLVTLLAPAGAFAFDGLTFIISACLLFALRPPVRRDREPPIEITSPEVFPEESPSKIILPRLSLPKILAGVSNDIREGILYVTGSKWLWISIIVASIANLGIVGSLYVALPKLVHDVYHAGVWLFGELGMANMVGSITGTLLIGQMSQLHRRGLITYLAVGGCGVGLVLFGLSFPFFIQVIVANIAGILVGLGLGVFGILWTTLLQELVPRDMLGRVSSIDDLGSFILTPVGYALAGILTDRVGPNQFFIFSGILLLILASLALCAREIRQLQ
jgi:MFS family permease